MKNAIFWHFMAFLSFSLNIYKLVAAEESTFHSASGCV